MGEIIMKANELMIGDWVETGHLDYNKVQEIARDNSMQWYISFACSATLFRAYEFEPIPLTYEILKKNGWKDAEFWCEYQEDNNSIHACLPDMRGKINGIEIEHFRCEYVHQYQHLLRLCGLDELADNFKV